jgi:hypothetical protein
VIAICLDLDDPALVARAGIRIATVIVSSLVFLSLLRIIRKSPPPGQKRIISRSLIYWTMGWLAVLFVVAIYLIVTPCALTLPPWLTVIFGAAYVWSIAGLAGIVDQVVENNARVNRDVKNIPDEVIALSLAKIIEDHPELLEVRDDR